MYCTVIHPPFLQPKVGERAAGAAPLYSGRLGRKTAGRETPLPRQHWAVAYGLAKSRVSGFGRGTRPTDADPTLGPVSGVER